MGAILLGTSGFCFESWIGTVYPTNIRQQDMFSYYINQFRLNSLEVNNTYYVMPSARTAAGLVRKSPDDFDFSVKLHAEMTHEPWFAGDRPRLDKSICAKFLFGIRPLVDSGKLGCLLAQFPPNVRPDSDTWDYLLELHEVFHDLPLVYEFRNKKWVSERTTQTLRELGIGLCTVDEPQVGPLMPFVPEVTSGIAYLRFHGRNPKWFEDRSVRYNYLYSKDELTEFIPTILSMASVSSKIYIQFNNCHAGAALRNVKMMQYLLGLDLPPLQGVLF